MDAQKYNKDMQLLKDYKTGWADISPTATPSQVLVTSSKHSNVEEQVDAVNAETPRSCDQQLKLWSKIFSYLFFQQMRVLM